MKERPILFSKPMVCAIREGRKTQTRRVFKGSMHDLSMIVANTTGNPNLAGLYPYGQPGDRLWVRESWRIGAWDENELAICIDYRDGPRKEWVTLPDGEEFERYWIQCSEELDDKGIKTDADGNYKWEPGQSPLRWRPSIHMPRWASRILLEIVSVRAERLQEISEDDAEEEGIDGINMPTGGDDYQDYWRDYMQPVDGDDGWPWFTGDQIASYRSLWQSINGPESWESNPWVWVIEFKVVQS